MTPQIIALRTFIVACLIGILASANGQTLTLDPIGVGASVTVTGVGGPPSSSVELFKNGSSVGSFTTSAGGQFSIPNIGTAASDQFYVAAGQVWNFNANGNTESWAGLAGDASVVSGGIWKQTNSVSTDMSVGIYGDALILTRARGLEVRLRYTGVGNRTASVIIKSAGPNGVANAGGDDGSTTIANTATVSPTTTFQTYVFDLGSSDTGTPTCWLDGTAPININFYLAGMAIGDVVEVDSIRLSESLRWEFDTVGDLSEWGGNANTTILATNAGTIRLNAGAAGNVVIARPFRNIGSTHFTKLQTRFRQVTATQPNLLRWNYFSNPAGYGTGGYQISTPANGAFQIITTNLTGSPTYGNTWGAGGAATLNFSQEAFAPLFANLAGEYAEIDYIRLLPTSPYGPSPTVVAAGSPVTPTYYVSSSGGNDAANGRSAATAWATFTNLDGLTLGAGTSVNLKRGDTWSNKRLRLSGKGAAGNPILLTAYGEGQNPIITGINLTNAPCIQWENPSFIKIEGMDCRDSKIGIYLRYTGGNLDGTGAMFRNTNVVITCCYFQNMDEKWSDTNGVVTVLPPYELSWGTGIWIGGNVPSPPGGPWASASTPILDDLSITHCGFKDVSSGVSGNFYYPPSYKGRFTNFRFEDSWVTGCEAGSFAFFYVDGGHARRVDTWLGGSQFYNTGTTGGFLQNCKNFTVADCEFAGNKRIGSAHDGVGFDFEGDCNNVAFTNNVLHDNDGSALLILNTVSNHTGLNMGANTVWNNARNPLDAGENNEFRHNPTGSTGSFTNIGVYRGANNAFGAVALYDNATRWTTDFAPANIRSATTWATVSTRPLVWNFTSSVESWGATNQWSGFTATGGALVGTSSGVDPYVESAATWVNTRERRWVHVRMSQTAGSTAQIFFQVETDATFTGPKAVAFPIIADGVMRDYVVDMGAAATYRGVVTKWRLDPADAAGSVMVIDTFASHADPYLASVTVVSSRVLDVRFNQAMLPTGGVFSPANFALSGAGQCSLSSQPSTVTMIPSTNGPTYRLTWNSGDMNGQPAVLTATAALDPRGNALWSGSQIAFNSVLSTNAPTVNAGANRSVCSSSPSLTLAGSFSGGATGGTWSGGAGTFNPNTNTLNAIYTPSAGEIATGNVTLTLTSVGQAAPCNAAVSQMTITINAAATANAGPAQTVAATNTVTLAGSRGGGATGAVWSGGAGSFNPSATTLNAIYTPTAGEKAARTLTLTLTSTGQLSPCGAAISQMTITFNSPPVASPIFLGTQTDVPVSRKIIGGQNPPTDADNDTLTVTSVTSAANGLTSTDGTNIFYAPNLSFNGMDAFTYKVNDSYGGTNTQSVTVLVSPNYNRIGVEDLGGSSMRLTYTGTPGYNYALDHTTNLAAPILWLPIATNTAGTNGILLFTNSFVLPEDFFRNRSVP